MKTIGTLVVLFLLAVRPLFADINDDLRNAASKGDLDRVQALLKKGARIDALDKKGNTAIRLAWDKGRNEVVQFLVTSGASLQGAPAGLAEFAENVKTKLLQDNIDKSINLNGGWDLAMTTPRGTSALQATLSQSGKTLRGLVRTDLGDVPVKGKLAGGVVNLAWPQAEAGTIGEVRGVARLAAGVTANRLPFEVRDGKLYPEGLSLGFSLTGKVEGDSIQGKATLGGFGEGTFTAKRPAARLRLVRVGDASVTAAPVTKTVSDKPLTGLNFVLSKTKCLVRVKAKEVNTHV